MITGRFEKEIRDIIHKCVKDLRIEVAPSGKNSGRLIDIELDIPKDKNHGDLSTNLAFRLSKTVGKNPYELALKLAENINNRLAGCHLKTEIIKVEAKQPGFINFWFSDKKLYDALESIAGKVTGYNRPGVRQKTKVNLEFVSANPTGPLTIAHGRQAAFGDTLANILARAGYRVTREYYLNDEGNQMDILARSIRHRYLEQMGEQSEMPENGYKGHYIADIAKEIKSKYGARFVKKESLAFFADFGCRWITDSIRRDLERFNVRFDIWFSQRRLNQTGKIRSALNFLSRKKLLYEKGGATWFKSSGLGDDKDRVVIKSTGEYTYLAPDIGYHMSKFKRGFNKIIDIWGPDHHGYISRLKAAVKTFEPSPDLLTVLLVQLCTLYKSGKAVQMSTRAGEYITLKDLIDEVGKDVARFFFLMRRRDSHLDFDLELAKKHSMDNPVYYIQYAHARICSILKFRNEKKGPVEAVLNRKYLKEPKELQIMKLLGVFPLMIEICAKRLEVFPLLSYLQDVAAAFHSYYDKHRIVSDDIRLTQARLFLCMAIRNVIADGLDLLGVSSPENM